MSKLLLVLIAALMLLATVTFRRPQESENLEYPRLRKIFNNWLLQQNKRFASSEESTYRFSIFVKNYKMIQKHNSKENSYTMGLNQFADLTQEEFKATYLGLKVDQEKIDREVEYVPNSQNADINWVTRGMVSPIKNQGQCGSCWAFSTVGNLEGVNAIRTNHLVTYSEQQLVDCSGSYGNMGCSGGLMDYAFKYVMQFGIETEADYPYTARDGSCKYDASKAQKVISGYSDVPPGNCNSLGTFLQSQPIAVGVDAETWQFYRGGVFSQCGTSLDHGVLLVGMTSDFWLVKNSWGSSWGEKGYIRLAPGDTCGICDTASTGNLKK